MTWRQTLGFVEDEPADFAAAQSRYRQLRNQPDRQVCESRRLKQAIEEAQRELLSQGFTRRRRHLRF